MFTYETFAPHALPSDPPLSTFIVEPGGTARSTWLNRRTGRLIERSFVLAPQPYEDFLFAVAKAVYAEARPVRPDAIWPADSATAKLSVERGELRMVIAGPTQALWRAELAEVARAFSRAAIFRPNYGALLPAMAQAEAPATHMESRWFAAVTPALPGQWPIPEQGGTLVRYVYAARFACASRCSDSSAPFARSIENADGSGRTEAIAPFRVAGRSGIYALRREEVELRNRRDEVERLLLSPLDREDEPLVRAFTCDWLQRQAAGDEIIARHSDFATWLSCP